MSDPNMRMGSGDGFGNNSSGRDASWQWSRMRPWMRVMAEQALPDFMHRRVDASDIVQQAMAEAWRSRETYLGTTTAERMAWLRIILKRTVLRQQERLLGAQKRDMRREFSIDALLDATSLRLERFAADPNAAPDAQAEKGEQEIEVTTALEKLSPDHRRVLMLRHFEDLSHETIAERMDRTPAAARMLWIRALKALREKLASTGS
jgi:RNA polymerase sigma-70 factor (ECF subfamily)